MAEEDALQHGGGQALNKRNELFAASFAMPSNQCFFVFFPILSSSNFTPAMLTYQPSATPLG